MILVHIYIIIAYISILYDISIDPSLFGVFSASNIPIISPHTKLIRDNTYYLTLVYTLLQPFYSHSQPFYTYHQNSNILSSSLSHRPGGTLQKLEVIISNRRSHHIYFVSKFEIELRVIKNICKLLPFTKNSSKNHKPSSSQHRKTILIVKLSDFNFIINFHIAYHNPL